MKTFFLLKFLSFIFLTNSVNDFLIFFSIKMNSRRKQITYFEIELDLRQQMDGETSGFSFVQCGGKSKHRKQVAVQCDEIVLKAAKHPSNHCRSLTMT